MTWLAKLTLYAYPRAFRRDFGADYLRTADDLRVHGHRSTFRIASRLLIDAITTAPAMRLEKHMKATKTGLIIAATITVFAGLVIGPQAFALVVLALVALALLTFGGRDRPIAPPDASVTRGWYWWVAGAAGAFLLGLAVVAITEEDGGLSTAAWATWMLSWLSAAVLALIGVALGAIRLATHRG